MSFTFLVRLKRNNLNKTLENSEKILYILCVVELVQKQDWFHIFMLLYKYNN